MYLSFALTYALRALGAHHRGRAKTNIGSSSWPFSLLLLISHREQLLLVQGHQMRDLLPTPRNRSNGRLPSPFSRVINTSTHLSIHKKALPRGERKLQDEYALDSRIHSRPDPLWNFRNLQKHSRKGLVMIFSKITRC